MKILYFSPRQFWPPDTGARLRDYYLSKELTRNAEVTYFGLRSPDEPEANVPPDVNPFANVVAGRRDRPYSVAKLLRGAIGPLPVTVLNYWSRDAADALKSLLRATQFDSAQVEGVHLLRYVPVIRAASPAMPIIADWHNIESEILRRYAATVRNLGRRTFALRTAHLVERAEDQLLRLCTAHTVASRREQTSLQHRNAGASIEVIENGVDVDYYSSVTPCADARDILFVGSMDYHANIDAVMWMATEIWPQLNRRLPKLRFTIAGRNPPPQITALARDGIVVTGTVADIRPYYQRALVAAVPLRIGGGTRLKILEAMAAEVPVVSTRLGAEGLDVVDGENILLADSPSEITSAIEALAGDRLLRQTLIANGRKLVASVYQWQGLGQRLYQIHKTAMLRSGN